MTQSIVGLLGIYFLIGAISALAGSTHGVSYQATFFDKLITTGTFSPAAIKEATRDGAPPIDLVDGDQLAEKLKELGLGPKKEMVEKVSIDKDWFKNL